MEAEKLFLPSKFSPLGFVMTVRETQSADKKSEVKWRVYPMPVGNTQTPSLFVKVWEP